MNPPANTEVYEGEIATFWFEDGILYAKSKNVPRTLEVQKRTYDLIRKISNGKKVCMLADASNSQPQDKQTREYIAQEMPKIFKAMAVLSESATGKVITSIFRGLKKDPVAVEMFPDEHSAKEWLKQYL